MFYRLNALGCTHVHESSRSSLHAVDYELPAKVVSAGFICVTWGAFLSF
jgi:hypothetical protein